MGVIGGTLAAHSGYVECMIQREPRMGVTSNSEDRLMTADEIASRLQLSVRRVRVYAASGKIPSIKLNKRDIRFHWPTVVARLTNATLE